MMSDIHGAVGAYVADALDPEERAAFTEHMRECPLCASEVRSLSETVAELSASVATAPPPQLREQVLQAAHRVRPLPPLPTQADADGASASPKQGSAAQDPGSRRVVRHDAASRFDEPDAQTPDERPDATVTELPRSKRVRLLTALAVAALVVAVVLGGWVVQLRSTADQQQQQQVAAHRAENELFSAADVQTRHLALQSGGTLTVVASQEQSRAMVVGPDLPPPMAGQEYQVWLMRDGTPTPSSHFADGSQRVWLTGDLSGIQALAVTVEPTGGSPAPTTPVLGTVEM